MFKDFNKFVDVDVPEIGFYYEDLIYESGVWKCIDISSNPKFGAAKYIMMQDGDLYGKGCTSVGWKKVEEPKNVFFEDYINEIIDTPEVGFRYEDLTTLPHAVYECIKVNDLDGDPFPYIMIDKHGKAHDFSVFNWKKVEEPKDA